ncbi:MAG: hypothetical protein FWC16_13305 [Defluviitaleaceae bacterium]|nr:hypothetical protein [Defluviitaleaceae bacterium]MCL2275898.1 hypothetical protein [Defluviitaleaceae bacterium]
MNTIRCNVCKKMFSFDGLPPEACPPCRERKNALFQEVRQMVKENPGITALEVHHRTGVPIPNLVKYIESGMLEIIKTKGDMDLGEVQVWIDNAKKKAVASAKAQQKAREEQDERELPNIVDIPDLHNSKKKPRINFIIDSK